MAYPRFGVFSCAVLWCVFQVVAPQDGIGFPETNEDESKKPADNRQPLFMPAQCDENELLYPGDQKDDWICDCKPSYIFHPSTNKCHPAFKQGPCLATQMLVMPKKGFIPVCVPNVCVSTGRVPYERPGFTTRCVRLGESCDTRQKVKMVYGVNAATIKVDCVPAPRGIILEAEIAQRMSDTDESDETRCLPGCKRSINGVCSPDTTQ